MRVLALALLVPFAASAQPLIPFVEMPPSWKDNPGVVYENAVTYAGSGGAMMLECGASIERKKGVYHFTALRKLAAALRPGEPVDLGITYAGPCAPPYLADLGVPRVKVWAGGEEHYAKCSQQELFVPWNATFIARYLAAVRAQWNEAATIHDSAGATLQSHIMATRQAGITNYNTDELAVSSTGCTGEETDKQAATAWHRAGYSVPRIKAAYKKITAGLRAISHLPISQSLLGTDKAAFPVPVAKPSLTLALVSICLKTGPCNTSFNELSGPQGSPPVPDMVLNAWSLGATPVLETNGNATVNGHPDSATSWDGLHDQTPATQAQFRQIVTYGNSLHPTGLRYLMVQPQDAGLEY